MRQPVVRDASVRRAWCASPSWVMRQSVVRNAPVRRARCVSLSCVMRQSVVRDAPVSRGWCASPSWVMRQSVVRNAPVRRARCVSLPCVTWLKMAAQDPERTSRPQDFTRPFFLRDFLWRHAWRSKQKRWLMKWKCQNLSKCSDVSGLCPSSVNVRYKLRYD